MKISIIVGGLALVFTLGMMSAGTTAKAPPLGSSQIPMLVPNEGRNVADKLATLLELRYTFPTTGKAYAAMLRANAANGRYDELNWKQLCDSLTADLRAVHPDIHLFVNAGIPGSPLARPSAANPVPATEAGQWAVPGVAYIRLNRFTGETENASSIRQFLISHQQAGTLILDLRGHGGGRFEELDAIIPFLYKRRTPLLDMAIARAAEQESGPLASSPSLQILPGTGPMVVRRHWAVPSARHRGLQDARVIALISNATGSAGEHLADALKVSGRATLIGSRTAGANHFGGEFQITDHFYAFLPMGRTYDPKTGEDWEGQGVAPDVPVMASDALGVALRSAGLSVAGARKVARRIERGLIQVPLGS